jgi:CRISPR/Cas system CMR-associated protein Cmr3 (group 5 of RAMP superfamily)
MPIYHIQPQDLFFFRDARPMESQSPGGGHGARWPHPAVFFDAFHAALWRACPDDATKIQHGFTAHSFYCKDKGARTVVRNGGTFFQTLATAGPFPVCQGQWLFPRPADAEVGGGYLRLITRSLGESDLPAVLQYPLGSTTPPSKENGSPWWTKNAIQAALLAGKQLPKDTFTDDALFATEWATGIGMNAATGTQDGERLYSAEYLRLREEVRLGLWASLPEERGFEGLDTIFPVGTSLSILVAGGQQRTCRVERQSSSDLTALLPVSPPRPPGCTRIKWVLLSPAVFPDVPAKGHPGGWLPTWIDSTNGAVLLTRVQVAARNGSTHREKRREPKDAALFQQCRLVAACVPKPVPVTGWTEALHVPPRATRPQKSGPRGTLLAVPAGTVYYFECATEPAAQALWELLSWHGAQTQGVSRIVHRRSSLLGEKGFGLGVCGTWDAFEQTAAPSTSSSPTSPTST